jgi:TPR repeat protein
MQRCNPTLKSPLPLLLAGIATAGALAVLAANLGGVAAGSEVDWLSHLAHSGDAGAQLQLGIAYRDGRYGLKPDTETGRYWLGMAAGNGNAYAADALANTYADAVGGVDGPGDTLQAVHWWEVAARGGNADAQEHLGQFMLGNGNIVQALAWLRDAADRGEPQAQRDLLHLYRQTPLPNTDLHRGENALAALGERMDSNGLKTLYAVWRTVKTSSPVMQSADALVTRANSGDPLAEYQLAMDYRNGAWAVEIDPLQAMTWLHRAAEAGNRLAIKTLAETHRSNQRDEVSTSPATAALPTDPADNRT